MRARYIVSWLLLLALTARGVAPEVGKDRLRKLVKLPSILFQPGWAFDPERGFRLGSSEHDVVARIAALRKDLRGDISDAEICQNIGDLYFSINQATNARGIWARAAELYRRRAEMRTEDGVLLAGFGQSLAGAGKTDEAESILRRAVRVAPAEWKCRVALGRFLDAEARREIQNRQRGAPGFPPTDDSAEAPGDRLSFPQVAQAQKRLAEAGECYESAVAAAPGEAEVYSGRGLHRCLETALLNQIRLASGEQQPGLTPLSDCFSQAGLADLQQACRLSPRDYELIGSTVLFEIYTVSAQRGEMDWNGFSWNSLPDKTQRSIHQAMTRLENLGQSPEPGVAAGALEVLGILQGPILRQTDSCISNLRRALALDPGREQAWEMLTATLAQAQRDDELLAGCQERIRIKDSARARLFSAKAFERLKQWDNAEEQVLAAVKLAPDDFTATLSLAALALKRSRDGSFLPEANNWLARAQELLNKLPASQKTRQQFVDLALTRGIYFALNDEIEIARRWVKAVIEQDKDNKFAGEILAAMDF